MYEVKNNKNILGKTSAQAFGVRVEQLLKSRGCSKAWLASKLNMSRQALNYMLKHGQKPRKIREIAAVFEISSEWLATGEGSLETIYTMNEKELIPVYDLIAPDLMPPMNKWSYPEKIWFFHENISSIFALRFKQAVVLKGNVYPVGSLFIFEKDAPIEKGNWYLESDETGSYFTQLLGLDHSEDHYSFRSGADTLAVLSQTGQDPVQGQSQVQIQGLLIAVTLYFKKG